MDPKYKVGDLVLLNRFGLLIYSETQAKVGIVIAGPYIIPLTLEGSKYTYWGYDIIVGFELIKLMPQEFLERIIDDEHEENAKGMEDIHK